MTTLIVGEERSKGEKASTSTVKDTCLFKVFLGKRRKTFHHFRHTPTCTKLTFISLFSFFKRFLKLTHLCDANHDESKSKSNLKCSNVLVNIFFNLSAGQFRGKNIYYNAKVNFGEKVNIDL